MYRLLLCAWYQILQLVAATEWGAWLGRRSSCLTFGVRAGTQSGSPAVPIGEQAPDGDFDTVMESVLNFAAFTAPMNVAGAASMSVPLSWSSGNLPIGSMFSAKRGQDGLLFELAMQLEIARPWMSRTPPVSAL